MGNLKDGHSQGLSFKNLGIFSNFQKEQGRPPFSLFSCALVIVDEYASVSLSLPKIVENA